MKVSDLIQQLEDMNPEAEVRFASQPNWPFEYVIKDVVEVHSIDEDEYNNEIKPSRKQVIYPPPYLDDEEVSDLDDEPSPVVYLVEGKQIGYLPGHVKEEIGWGI